MQLSACERRDERGADHFVPRVLQRGALVLHGATSRATVDGADVGLSPAEFSVTAALFAQPGLPLSREAIAAALAPDAHLAPACMIDVYVWRARAKLAAAGLKRAIETVAGRGYRALGGEDEGEPAGSPTGRGLGAVLVGA